MDLDVVLQGLFIFHSGIALFFWISYCLLTGKQRRKLGHAAFMTVLGVFPGLLVTYIEVGWDPLWVNVTGFQLTLGATYVLVSALHERAHADLKTINSWRARKTFAHRSNGKKDDRMRLKRELARVIHERYHGKST